MNMIRTNFDIDNPPPLSDDEREQLRRLATLTDDDIDYSDIPRQEFANAVPLRDVMFRPVKQSTTVRIDADVLHWLKSKGRGYQTRINAILRDAMARDTR